MNKQTTIKPPDGNVHARLSEARQRFHALQLKKSGRFPKGRGGYFELGDFIVPALKVFHDTGLNGYVSFTDKIAMLRIVNQSDASDEIVLTSPLGSASLHGCHEVQNIGAVQTYQRRYLWMAALEIVEHDAIEPTTGEAEPEQQTEAQHISDSQWATIVQKVKAAKADTTALKNHVGAENLKVLTADQYDKVIEYLDDKMSEAVKADTLAKEPA